MAYIDETNRFVMMRGIIGIAEKAMGGKMMPARLLLWHPRAFISSMILEAMVVHKTKRLSKRLMKLIRMQVSLNIACPFCIDMNSHEFTKYQITYEEISAMQGLVKIKDVQSLTYHEKLVLYYAKYATMTPVAIPKALVDKMLNTFSEKEYTIIVTTVAQVAYWTRVIQGFGIKPAGFLDSCDLERLYP